MKTKPKSSIPTPDSAPESPVSRSQISERAYEIWLKQGSPENRDLDHWLEAERQLVRGAVHDDATRLTADPDDPASSEAAEMDEEISHMAEQPGRRSATSTL